MKNLQINTPTKGIQQYTLIDDDSNHIYIYDKLESEPVIFSILHTNGLLYNPSNWDRSENDKSVGIVIHYPFGSPFIFKGFYHYGQGPLSWAYSNPSEFLPLEIFKEGGSYYDISIPYIADETVSPLGFSSVLSSLGIMNPNETKLMASFTNYLASEFDNSPANPQSSVLQKFISQSFKNGKTPRGALIKELIIINAFWSKLKELVSLIGYDFWPSSFTATYPSYSCIQPFISRDIRGELVMFTYWWNNSSLSSIGMQNIYVTMGGALNFAIPPCLPLITDF